MTKANSNSLRKKSNLLKAILLSWLCMGILLGIYFQPVISPFIWALWFLFAASACITICISSKSISDHSIRQRNLAQPREREFRRIY